MRTARPGRLLAAERGADGVAREREALLVALRDRERPAKPKLTPEEQSAQAKQQVQQLITLYEQNKPKFVVQKQEIVQSASQPSSSMVLPSSHSSSASFR